MSIDISALDFFFVIICVSSTVARTFIIVVFDVDPQSLEN